jgi:hypothetical protein
MPRKPIDYSKGLIYKIVCKDVNIKEGYYGSTTDLRNRKHTHKTSYYNVKSTGYNSPIYNFIRCNGGWDNWNIILIKEYPCNSKLELEREERRCMEEDHNRLNNNLPTRTQKEYRIANIDKIKELQKNYYIDNKEKINNINRQYAINNIDKIKKYNKQYRNDNADKIKEQKKQYLIVNADKKKQWDKQYYIANADKIKQKNQTLITCECGCVITKGAKSNHLKSKKHKKLLNQNQE